ncbi:hypothetical protein AB0N87_31100 [Streptomyces sp. NPDC093228]|jgi:hypothetical protein|uniref:hypothetical protein n=1 Tax=unclassified Streptomyces TaxID=2593676 RepID=UPI000740C8F5|nr:hypothetical protein [Streptomyces sp. NRRL F-5122]KUJ40179.1 hypothetical protein ADL25_18925 [Streptomyces sp. NRRL F-5122]
MGTKTVDEAGIETGAETTNDEDKVNATEAGETAGDTGEKPANEVVSEETAPEETAPEELAPEEAASEGQSGVGQGAGAVVSAGLGVVSLTGSWMGTVAAARETLVGQLQTSSSASVAKQIQAVYGDAWQATALWGGVFALAALLVGVVVLARPAFGAPGRPQAPWIKSAAWAGVALGVVGLLLAVLKYTDVLLGLPSAG